MPLKCRSDHGKSLFEFARANVEGELLDGAVDLAQIDLNSGIIPELTPEILTEIPDSMH